MIGSAALGIGRPSFAIDIGGIHVVVASDEPALIVEPTGAAAQFVATPGRADMSIEVEWGVPVEGAASDLVFDARPGLWRLYQEGAFRRFVLGSPALGPEPYQDATFDDSYRHGRIRLRRELFAGRMPLYPLDYPLDELLIVHRLSRGEGIEIHATGIVTTDGRGHLFAGQSGAGKTTLAKLLQANSDVLILSDERIILRQESGVVWMYGTPWHGEGRIATNGRAPLASVSFLHQATRNELVPRMATDAAARLFACSFTPFHDAAGIDFSLEFLAEVVTRCRCDDFCFTPDQGAVNLIGALG